MNLHPLPVPEVVEFDMPGVDARSDGLTIRLQEFSERSEAVVANNSPQLIYAFFPHSLAKLFAFQRKF
jgi:hypothetical protein